MVSGAGTNLNVGGGHRFEAKGGAQQCAGKKFLVVPASTFWL